MTINFKKSLKLVFLMIASLLIATASATIYDYMNLNGTVGVQGMSLKWQGGNDATNAGASINGVTANLNQLKGPPNGTRIYADPVRLNNTGGSAQSFNLTISSITGDTSYLDSIYVRMYSFNTSGWIGNLTVWSGGAKGSDLTGLSIPSHNLWRFQWEITWKATAQISHSVTANLKIQVPVA